MKIDFETLAYMPDHIETRWASAENPSGEKGGGCRSNDGRKRNACICPLKAGESAVLLDIRDTSGTIRRIWATISERSPQMLRALRLEITWDGEETPAINVPMGDFFCHSLGQMSSFENALFSSPEGRSFNCIVPMPFRKGARIVVHNESDRDLKMLFYDVNFTVAEAHADSVLYLHALWRRENPTREEEDFEILPRLRGRGRFLGLCAGVRADTGRYFKSWWGEGEVKVYLDGDEGSPSLCGTGTEDYIGTAWGQGKYAHAFQGCPIADEERMHYGFYRLHLPDPIWFRRDIRVTIQQIGCWNPETIRQMQQSGLRLRHGSKSFAMEEAVEKIPYGFFEREDDWSSCAWFYLDVPVSPFSGLAEVKERIAGLEGPPAREQALA